MKNKIIETISGYENDGFEKNISTFRELNSKQTLDKEIKNNLPETMEKYEQDRLKRIDLEIKIGKVICLLFIFSLILLFIYETFIKSE